MGHPMDYDPKRNARTYLASDIWASNQQLKNFAQNQLTVMCTTRGELRLIEGMYGKQIGQFLQKDE